MLLPYLLTRACLFFLGATAATINIDVGDGDFTFDPDTITAAVGDELHFHFYPQNHSVIQGDFMNACHPTAGGGFYSGFMPVDSGEGDNMFVVTVSSTEPMFFYCGQVGHCKSGMVGVVNPSSSETLDLYRSAASKASSVMVPNAVMGGQIVPNDDDNGKSSTSLSASGTAPPTSSAALATATQITSSQGTSAAGSESTTIPPSGTQPTASTGSPPATATTPVQTAGSNKRDYPLGMLAVIGLSILSATLTRLIVW